MQALILPLLVFTSLLPPSHLVYLSEDGGYRDIVVKISETLDRKKCSNIISGIKVRKCYLLELLTFFMNDVTV